jgi:EPTP domain
MGIDTPVAHEAIASAGRIAGGLLSEHQRLPTSGARTALPFHLEGALFLAVPQLSEEVPGQAAHMNAGNSDIDAIIYRWEGGRFVEHERLFTPAGEDVTVFEIGGNVFLGTVSVRTGAGPYDMNAFADLYLRDGGHWERFQAIPAFAGKQLHHFSIDGRHFLGLAQGVTLPHAAPVHPRESCILEWTGDRFVPFQVLDGQWGYNWHDFEIAGQHFLAYADHTSPSLIYRWDDASFVPFQTFSAQFGRAFTTFEQDGQFWLVHAAIQGETILYRWNGSAFVEQRVLGGAGGRELEIIRTDTGLYLVRICFIQGTPADPKTDLMSQIYRWEDGGFVKAGEFPTFGGTDATAFEADGERFLAVSNSLTPDVRFRQDTIIYRLHL